jgi:hypothetical protein
MGTSFVPLLADLFLYSYEAEFIQKLAIVREKIKRSLWSSTQHSGILTISCHISCYFHTYIDSIYSSDFETKDTTEFASPVS